MKTKISILLLSVSIVCGIILLFFGIRDTSRQNELHRDFEETPGFLSDCRVYSSDAEKTSYILTYSYQVDGREYTVSAEYGMGTVPKQGSQRMVWYNPTRPEEAVLAGGGTGELFLFMGGLFLGVPLVILLGMLVASGRFAENGFLHCALDIGVGVVLMGAGAGALYIIGGTLDLGKIWETFAPPRVFLLLIPALMILAGAFQMVKSIFLWAKRVPGKRNT